MVLPFPRKFQYAHAAVAATALCGVLLWEGNAPHLCGIVFAWIMVATVGFNIAGGLGSPAGSYLFFVTVLTGVLGTVVKAVLNEPLLENMPNAGQTLTIYLAGTCGLVLAIKLSQYFRPARPFLQGGLTKENTTLVVAGCFVITAVIPLALQLANPDQSNGPVENGSIASLVRQLNLAAPLGILIAVYQKTKSTNGQSSFTWLAMMIAIYLTILGIFGYSKEATFYPVFAWIIAAAAARLRVSLPKMLVMGCLIGGAILILVPFSQYGRNFRGQGPEKAIELLSHPLQTRELAKAAETVEESSGTHWFRKPMGILDRLTMVPIDSALIARTDQAGTIGMRNVFFTLENIVPHFLAPNKPNLLSGNEYAHELDILAPSDITTGISFSPYSEAYHLAGWAGVLLLVPGLCLIMFVITDWATGTVDDTPWALFYIAAFGHAGAEGGIVIPIYTASTSTIALVVTYLIMIYIAPLLGTLLIGPEHRRRPTPNPNQS